MVHPSNRLRRRHRPKRNFPSPSTAISMPKGPTSTRHRLPAATTLAFPKPCSVARLGFGGKQMIEGGGTALSSTESIHLLDAGDRPAAASVAGLTQIPDLVEGKRRAARSSRTVPQNRTLAICRLPSVTTSIKACFDADHVSLLGMPYGRRYRDATRQTSGCRNSRRSSRFPASWAACMRRKVHQATRRNPPSLSKPEEPPPRPRNPVLPGEGSAGRPGSLGSCRLLLRVPHTGGKPRPAVSGDQAAGG